MKPLIEEYTGKNPDDESYTVDADLPEYIEENKKQKEAFASKFQIDFEEAEYRENQYLWGKKLPKLPFNKHPRVKRVVFHMRAKPYNHRDT